MSKKKNDKKIPILEPKFKDVLACRDAKMKPFIEIFISEPENIYQENLGTIAGIFEITDFSEDSSYIVNYLVSIIKKEYFSRPKRGAVESFEAALHKANLALSKLASHGSVSWIGNINAICAVFEKNNLHVSQTGSACMLLLRSGMLTNISGSGKDAQDTNPLKTFQDLISGRVEKDDKLIAATSEIFEIFSMEEIKKSALKFSKKNFAQFLNTALVNELERAAALVIDISEKEELEVQTPPKISSVNAFSQAAFQKSAPPAAVKKTQEEKKEIIEEIKEEFQKTKDGFVDQKTGHIYIKDGDISLESQTEKTEYFSFPREKIARGTSGFFASLKKAAKTGLSKMKFGKRPEALEEKIAASLAAEEKPYPDQSKIIIKEEKIPPSRKFMSALERALALLRSVFLSIKIFLASKILFPSFCFLRNLWGKIIQKYKSRKEASRVSVSVSAEMPEENKFEKFPDEKNKLQEFWSQPAQKKSAFRDNLAAFPGRLMPSFSRTKNILQSLSFRQKIYALAFAAAILIIPYFIAKYGKEEPKEITVPQEEQLSAIPLEQDINVKRIGNLAGIYQGENILSPVSINGKNFAAGKDKIISLSDSKEYPLPSEFQNADLISQMDDLNFIFIIKDKEIAAFSATAGKFQNNNISIPDGSDIISARSYLTYLYLLDVKNSQIYRYPRAEGGFGEKTDWLKDTVDFTSAKDMAINDNVYVTDGKSVYKFFRGKKQDYAPEETATPVIFDKLYTKPDWENLYVLDKVNSRILKLDKDGKIIAQYYNSEIGNANDFAVDEENNVVYVSSENSVKSFNIEI